jgi:hypothetical protein
MNSRQPSMIEVLQPHRFPNHPKRAEATRTIVQPDIDRYEAAEAAAGGGDEAEHPAPPARRRVAAGGVA